MNIEAQRVRAQGARLRPGRCRHPSEMLLEDLRPHLSNHWWNYLQTYGSRHRHGYVKGFPYPKSQPQAARRDAWPPDGGLPGSDLDFMREQYFDLSGVDYAIMNPLSPTGQGEQNNEFSAAHGASPRTSGS